METRNGSKPPPNQSASGEGILLKMEAIRNDEEEAWGAVQGGGGEEAPWDGADEQAAEAAQAGEGPPEIEDERIVVTTDKSRYDPGRSTTAGDAEIVVAFENGAAQADDWVGIYPSDSVEKISGGEFDGLMVVPGGSVDWAYACGDRNCNGIVPEGVLTFDANLIQSGMYVAILAMNGPSPPYPILALSDEFEVVGVGTATATTKDDVVASSMGGGNGGGGVEGTHQPLGGPAGQGQGQGSGGDSSGICDADVEHINWRDEVSGNEELRGEAISGDERDELGGDDSITGRALCPPSSRSSSGANSYTMATKDDVPRASSRKRKHAEDDGNVSAPESSRRRSSQERSFRSSNLESYPSDPTQETSSVLTPFPHYQCHSPLPPESNVLALTQSSLPQVMNETGSAGTGSGREPSMERARADLAEDGSRSERDGRRTINGARTIQEADVHGTSPACRRSSRLSGSSANNSLSLATPTQPTTSSRGARTWHHSFTALAIRAEANGDIFAQVKESGPYIKIIPYQDGRNGLIEWIKSQELEDKLDEARKNPGTKVKMPPGSKANCSANFHRSSTPAAPAAPTEDSDGVRRAEGGYCVADALQTLLVQTGMLPPNIPYTDSNGQRHSDYGMYLRHVSPGGRLSLKALCCHVNGTGTASMPINIVKVNKLEGVKDFYNKGTDEDRLKHVLNLAENHNLLVQYYSCTNKSRSHCVGVANGFVYDNDAKTGGKYDMKSYFADNMAGVFKAVAIVPRT